MYHDPCVKEILSMPADLILKPGREKSLLRRHPWVFSGAVEKLCGSAEAGDCVRVLSHDGNFLCRGFYSPSSQIRVRALSFDESCSDIPALIRSRLHAACSRRRSLMDQGNEGVRLAAAEGDFLPGLCADKYGDFIVLSISCCGMDRCRDTIVTALSELFPECSFYERSDTKSRLKEGLKERCGVIRGTEPPDLLYFKEGGQIFIPADLKHGHKTGAYLDQRQNRMHAGTLAKGARVLNCFSYTGGFGLWALRGGAQRVTHVDVSKSVLEAAKAGTAFNHLDPGHCQFVRADVFDFLRKEVERQEKYDLVILDPPKFADSAAALRTACRGYQDINRLGFSLLTPGGHLLTFSCSGLMEPPLFQKIVADAALEAGTPAQICAFLHQDSDHAVSLPCPESLYLKGLDVIVCA